MGSVTRVGSLTVLLSLATAFPVHAGEDGDHDALRTCLRRWKDHPFKLSKDGVPDYRTINATVKVLGIGENPTDARKTESPELVLVKPAVGVLSKLKLRLMNPNGWYCLKANVTVLAKSEITAACKARVESGSDDVVVIGSGEKGVTVLGKTAVNWECP